MEHADFVFVLVDAGNFMAKLGKAGAAHQPDVTGTNDGDFHDFA
jgi:hypothetical protein